MPMAARSRGVRPFLCQGLPDDGLRVAPDLERIVLHIAGLGIDLLVLLLADRDDAARPVEHDEARAGRALVDGADILSHGLPRNVLLSGDGRRVLLGRVGVDPGGSVNRHMQPELRAAPEDVLGAARPFAAHQVIDFRRRQAGAEILAEIGQRLAPRPEAPRSACRRRGRGDGRAARAGRASAGARWRRSGRNPHPACRRPASWRSRSRPASWPGR